MKPPHAITSVSLVLILLVSGIIAGQPAGSESVPLDPQRIKTLPPQEDQALAGIPNGLTLIAPAHYSFGVTAGPDGSIYFNEFNRMRMLRLDAEGQLSIVYRKKGGLFGLLVDDQGDIYRGMDSAKMDGGVTRLDPNGQEHFLIKDITRPRQLASDVQGNVYAVLELGQIDRWDRDTSKTETLLSGLSIPQGVAVGPDGSVYFSEYGAMGDRGAALKAGRVRVRRPNGDIKILAEGFWRARGLAYHPSGDLYLTTEANAWDQGNSGLLVRIDSSGNVRRVIQGWDYPQFPAIDAQGRILITFGRDNWLAAFDPKISFTQYGWPSHPDIIIAAHGGRWQPGEPATTPQENAIKLALKIEGLELEGSVKLSSKEGILSGWLRIPAHYFSLSKAELPYHTPEMPAPGMFVLPSIKISAAKGYCRAAALPVRNHGCSRWPMDYKTGRELPAPDFHEEPIAYLIYFEWSHDRRYASWPHLSPAETMQETHKAHNGKKD